MLRTGLAGVYWQVQVRYVGHERRGRLGLALQGASRLLRNGAAGEVGSGMRAMAWNGAAGGFGSVVARRVAEVQGSAGLDGRCKAC